tara:strand:+ start:231 stop:533 length:303 start_codon:yes stop_codon:yes gene_type:complete
MLVVQQEPVVPLMLLVPEVVVLVALEVFHLQTIRLVVVALDKRSHLSLVLFFLLLFPLHQPTPRYQTVAQHLKLPLELLDYMVVEAAAHVSSRTLAGLIP